jgi:hypothetical protein
LLDTFRNKTESNTTAWEPSWILLKNFSNFRCTTIHKQNHWVFLVKAFTKALHLGYSIKRRKPVIYKDLKCISCDLNEEETWDHFVNCKGYNNAWAQIHRELRTKITTAIKRLTPRIFSNSSNSDRTIARTINGIMGHSYESQEFSTFKNLATEMKWSTTFNQTLHKFLQIPMSKCNTIAAKWLMEFSFLFKTHIWLARCSTVANWEIQHGITTKMKQGKEGRSKPTNTQHTLLNEDSDQNNNIRHGPSQHTEYHLDTDIWVLDDIPKRNTTTPNHICISKEKMETPERGE